MYFRQSLVVRFAIISTFYAFRLCWILSIYPDKHTCWTNTSLATSLAYNMRATAKSSSKTVDAEGWGISLSFPYQQKQRGWDETVYYLLSILDAFHLESSPRGTDNFYSVALEVFKATKACRTEGNPWNLLQWLFHITRERLLGAYTTWNSSYRPEPNIMWPVDPKQLICVETTKPPI